MLISIIITVYKTEAYIERCIRSVMEQTVSGYEVVVVDDCSPDCSMSILQEVAKEYNNDVELRIIRNQQNRGSGYTRNVGIQAATGDYVIFVDSDDYIAPNYIELLSAEVQNNSSDIVSFNYLEMRAASSRVISAPIFNSSEANIVALFSNKIHNSLCNKLFRRSLFTENNISIPEGLNMYDDKSVCFKLFYFASKFSHLPQTLYFYDKAREASITKLNTSTYVEAMMKVVDVIDEFFAQHPASDDVQKAIVANKMHMAGYIILYGSPQEIKENLPKLGKVPFGMLFSEKAIPPHYRLAVICNQYGMGALSKIIKWGLHSVQHLNGKKK